MKSWLSFPVKLYAGTGLFIGSGIFTINMYHGLKYGVGDSRLFGKKYSSNGSLQTRILRESGNLFECLIASVPKSIFYGMIFPIFLYDLNFFYQTDNFEFWKFFIPFFWNQLDNLHIHREQVHGYPIRYRKSQIVTYRKYNGSENLW